MQLKNIHLVIFCVVFTVAQFWFGIGGITMEAKGSMILFAPFRLWFLNWFLLMFAVFLAKHSKNLYGVLIFLLATLLHYAITVSYVIAEINRYRIAPNEEEGLGLILARYPEQLVYGTVTYLLGNLFIWGLFIRGLFSKRGSLS